MTDTASPIPHRKQLKPGRCFERIGDAINEYRRIRDDMRVETGKRKQRDNVAALDLLWQQLTAQEKQQIRREFSEWEKR